MPARAGFIIMGDENCGCSNVIPMGDWVKQESKNPDICTGCIVGVVASWYKEELTERNLTDQANELLALGTNPEGSPEAVAQKLDSIKAAVDSSVRCRLLDFDCQAQLYTREGVIEDG